MAAISRLPEDDDKQALVVLYLVMPDFACLAYELHGKPQTRDGLMSVKKSLELVMQQRIMMNTRQVGNI